MRVSWANAFGAVCVRYVVWRVVLGTMGMGLRRENRVKAMASFMHGWCILSTYSSRI